MVTRGISQAQSLGMCEHIVFGQRCYKCGKRVAKSHDLTKEYLMRMWTD